MEKTFIASLVLPQTDRFFIDDSLDELRQLIVTAGGEVCGTKLFRRDEINPSTLIGSGQVEELNRELDAAGAQTIVFDVNHIKPGQYLALEKLTGKKILSRCDIILDIFALRASSSEARIQVELAQLINTLPRIRGKGLELSRLGGGIGTRGPGETKLETDRRHITHRIQKLKRKLSDIESVRGTKRKKRGSVFTVAVAGYTNAGKSSLVRSLSKKDLFVENRLFATLDSFTRSVYLGDGTSALFTDTVGFIRNLPASLIKAFRSTFEEIGYADIVLVVADISVHDWKDRLEVVNKELSEIGITQSVLFLNKSDLADFDRIKEAADAFPEAVIGSVLNGNAIDQLKAMILSSMKKRGGISPDLADT